ncbi:hypothetical protein GCM10017673_17390 [Streptosporangium violaceochromogenes]|nr:hypothetical protein GCM10017673_17390 [Streptosporangium violaceochromogenes]
MVTVKADMAIARIRLGDVKEGVDYACSSLAATHSMASPLGWDRLDQVAKELRKSRTAVARGFRAEFAATRPKETQPSLP